MVQFTIGNLAETKMPQGIVPGSIDIIMCRNVLIYFHQDQITKVLSKLNSALTDEGLLVVTPIELLGIADKLFERLNYPGVAVLKKAKRPAPFPVGGAQLVVHHNALSMTSELLETDLLKSSAAYQFPEPATTTRPPDLTVPTIPAITAAVGEAVKVPLSDAAADAELAKTAQRFFEQGRYKECVAQLLNINPSQMAEPARVTMLALAYSNDGDLPAALTAGSTKRSDTTSSIILFTTSKLLSCKPGGGKESGCHRRETALLFLMPDFVVAEFNLATVCCSAKQEKPARQ